MNPGRKKKITKEFGNRLKKIRNDKKISLRQLASETEIEHAHIARMEIGEVNPTLTTVILLAEALQVDPCVLIAPLKQ